MKKIAVMGTGYVGLVSGTCFADSGNDVICCDIDQDKIKGLRQGKIPIYEPGLEELVRKNTAAGRLHFTTDIAQAIQAADIIYIAVGTPMADDGNADLFYVRQVAETIAENLNAYKIIVNKSTVPVGTAQLVSEIIQAGLDEAGLVATFDVVSNPEFLREGSAVDDCLNMERAVIGAVSDRAAQTISELHEPFTNNILVTNWESAELIKYASNGFLATKISFINDIANICERVGADVQQVALGMGMDSRIGSKFLNAGIGYGGSCFPKDTRALLHTATESGYDFSLLRAVIQTNERQRVKIVNKLEDVLGDLTDKTIAILGLSFKPQTNDMREAPALAIIPALLENGAAVQAYDPIAIPEARQLLGEDVRYMADLYDAVQGADACLLLTEWEQIVSMDVDRVKAALKTPVLIDGRNCFELDAMRAKGFIYHSVGRPPVNENSILNG